MKILKTFLGIFNHHTFDYYHAKFRQNRRKKFFGCTVVQKWSENVQNNFFSDFDEILRGNSQKYGDEKYQEKFSKFSFFGPFFNSVRKRPL